MANITRQYRDRSASASSPKSQPQLSRTCQNCSHAKIRCDRTRNLPSCDRCHRLGKHCVFRPTKRRNNGNKQDVRIEALESQLNQLLQARDSDSNSGADSPELSSHQEEVEKAKPATSVPGSPRNSVASSSTAHTEGSRNLVASSSLFIDNDSPRDIIDRGLVTSKTAEILLETYKNVLTPHFPFVVIAPQTTVKKLRQEKPFLLLAIFAAASYEDMPLQRALGTEMKQAISNGLFLGEELSFELLQGLLVHLAWSQYHPRPRRYSQYLQLAISIIIDSRLDRQPEPTSWRLPDTNSGRDSSYSAHQPARSRDEQRAVAGCFYLSSTVSILMQKLTTFPYSSFIEQSCKSLSSEAEYSTDRSLYYIIQLQHIMETIDRIAAENKEKINSSDSWAEVHLMRIISELDSFKTRLPFFMSESLVLSIQFHTVELFLCQNALFDRNVTRPNALQQWSSWGLEALCLGLAAAKSLLGFYLSLPLRAELALNNSEWIQVSFGLVVATKLSVTSTESSVDLQTAALRRALDMPNVLRQLVLRIQTLVSNRIDARGDRDVFWNYEQRVKRMQVWFENHSRSTPTPPSTHQDQPERPPLENHRPSGDHVQQYNWQSPSQSTPSPTPPYPDTTASMTTLPQRSLPLTPLLISQNTSPPSNHLFATNFMNWDGTPTPEGIDAHQTDSFLPDSTIDSILGDWITFPASMP